MKLLHKDYKRSENLEVRKLNGPGMNKVEKGLTESVLAVVDEFNMDINTTGARQLKTD